MSTDTKAAPAPAAKKDTKVSAEAEVNEPIVIDLGKKNNKQVRKLRKGKPGRLMNRVEEAIEHLRENGAMAADTQPVVIVIRQKKKRKGGRVAKAWGLG